MKYKFETIESTHLPEGKRLWDYLFIDLWALPLTFETVKVSSDIARFESSST